MEMTANNPDLQNDTINIILEFESPECDAHRENGIERDEVNGGIAVNLIQISPELLASAVSSPILSRSAENSPESSTIQLQGTPRSGVPSRRKRYNPQSKNSRKSKSNLTSPSVADPMISHTNPTSVISCQQESFNQCNENKKYACIQLVHSKAKQQEVTMDSPQGNATNEKEGTQISNATKLALKNFLKRKSTGNDGKTNQNKETGSPEMEGALPANEDGGLSKEDEISLENESCIANSQSTTPTGVKSKEILAKVQQADVTQPNDDCSQEEEEKRDDITVTTDQSIKEKPLSKMASATSLCVTEDETMTVTQEVDILVLDLVLEAGHSPDQAEISQSKVHSGAKKEKTKKSFECVECGKYFDSSKGYKRHLNIHYDIRPHKCNECEKSFRQRGHLEKHKLLHSDEKPFVCQYCGHGFRCKYLLRDHERIHTGEKPCKCNICGEMFRSLGVVSDHQRNVHKIRPPRSRSNASVRKTSFECSICRKTFSWSSALSAHKKTHSDVWAYKCNKCPKVFKLYSNLWNHKRSHSNIKPFKCDLCGQHLKRRGNLKRHLLTQHDPEEAEMCLKTSQEFVVSRTRARKAY